MGAGLFFAHNKQTIMKTIKLGETNSGPCSTFGGPDDSGMSHTEGVALYPGWLMVSHHCAHALFLERPTEMDGNEFPRGRGLNPDAFYCAMRWDYKVMSPGALARSWVRVTANGRTCYVRPVDWGPNERTGRLIDLSPGAAQFLGVKTDDVVEATLL